MSSSPSVPASPPAAAADSALAAASSPSSAPASISTTVVKKKVSFDEIEFLEFLTILGDNPAVSAGAPVALGNDLHRRSMMDIDFYERNRGKRRNRKKLVLPVDARARL
jgi:hypothetical protein